MCRINSDKGRYRAGRQPPGNPLKASYVTPLRPFLSGDEQPCRDDIVAHWVSSIKPFMIFATTLPTHTGIYRLFARQKVVVPAELY